MNLQKGKGNQKGHIISVTVENRFGVLARIAGLFSARGYNIDSLCVAETEDPTVSMMTIVVRGEEDVLEQIYKQLNKLVDVIKVQDITGQEFIDRELALVKVHTANASSRLEVMQLVSIFRARVVDVGKKTLTVEVVGSSSKVKALLELLRTFGIQEIIRTGRIAITREFGK